MNPYQELLLQLDRPVAQSGGLSHTASSCVPLLLIDPTERLSEIGSGEDFRDRFAEIDSAMAKRLEKREIAHIDLAHLQQLEDFGEELLRAAKRALRRRHHAVAEELGVFIAAIDWESRSIEDFEENWLKIPARRELFRAMVFVVTGIEAVQEEWRARVAGIAKRFCHHVDPTLFVIVTRETLIHGFSPIRVHKGTYADFKKASGARVESIESGNPRYWTNLANAFARGYSEGRDAERFGTFIYLACFPSRNLARRVDAQLRQYFPAIAKRDDEPPQFGFAPSSSDSTDVVPLFAEWKIKKPTVDDPTPFDERRPKESVSANAMARTQANTADGAEWDVDLAMGARHVKVRFNPQLEFSNEAREQPTSDHTEQDERAAEEEQERVRRYLRSPDTAENTIERPTERDRRLTQAWKAAAFLKVLELAFPAVLHAAHTNAEGTYRLYLLLSHFAGRGIQTDTAALDAEPWTSFLKDERLRNCCRFAFADPTGEEEPLVHPFASARALRQHLDGLLRSSRDLDAENWNERIKLLDQIVVRTIDQATTATRNYREVVHKTSANFEPYAMLLLKAARDTGSNTHGSNQANVPTAAMDMFARIEQGLRENDEMLNVASIWLARLSLAEYPKSLHQWVQKTRTELFLTAEQKTKPDADIPKQYFEKFEADELNESGQRYVSLLEIWAAGCPQSLPEPQNLKVSLKSCIGFLEHARDRSHGAIAFEALVGLVRVYSLAACVFGVPHVGNKLEARQYEARAYDALRAAESMTKQFRERVLTVELCKGILLERQARWVEAEDEYTRIQRSAAESGYVELAARAGYSAMRARALKPSKPARRALFWAQGLLRLHLARSPFFERTERSLFISYRRDIQTWAKELCNALSREATAESSFKLWVDYDSIIDANVEYRAEMQLGLDRASMVLFLFSPAYFESHWCTYELSTAIARKQLNGQRLAWVCLDDSCPESKLRDPRGRVMELARSAAKLASDVNFFNEQLAQVLTEEPFYPEVLRTPATGHSADPQQVVSKECYRTLMR